jgi:hypothetical protein
MTTQEPKLNNKDAAFPKVLPNIIEDDAHRVHHPISTNTIPLSESSDPGYVDASLTSSSTFLDQGYDVAPHASSSTEATTKDMMLLLTPPTPPPPYSCTKDV